MAGDFGVRQMGFVLDVLGRKDVEMEEEYVVGVVYQDVDS